MRSHATKLVAVACVFAAFLLGAAAASAAPFVNGIFPLGSEVGTNNKIVAGPDGNVWLTVEDGTNDVARVDPAGQVQEFDIEGIENAVGIAPGPDGNLWITEVEKAARFAPADPLNTDKSFTVAGIGAESQIVAGPDGLMWVASGNSVVRFGTADPTTVQPVAVSGELAPKDIDVAGPLIVIADNSGGNRIVTFTAGGTQKDFPIASGAQGVAGAPSGQLAYSAPQAEPEQVGLITPPNPALPIPVPGDPFGVDLGPDGAYWVVQFAEAGLTRFTSTGQATFLGGLPDESARQITAGPGSTLWVTLTKNEANGVVPSVARISGVDLPVVNQPPPPAVSPQTEIDKGPKKVIKTRKKKAKVKFRFSSPTPGVTFECWLMRVSKKAQLAILKYKSCNSPKVYRLRPGKYKFRVRAVNGGTPDLTPAVRNFRIVRTR